MIPFLLFLVVAVAVVSGVLVHLKRPTSTDEIESYKARLLESFEGTPRTMNGVPMLFLKRGGFEAAVELTWRKGFTFYARPEEPFDGHLQIGPEGMASVAARMIGRTDYETGDPAFDQDWLILGPSDEFLREALYHGVQDQVKTLGARGSLVLSVNPAQMLLRLTDVYGGRSVRAEALVSLVSAGLRIAESIPRKKLVDVTETKTRVNMPDTACQVCGTPLSGEVVACGTCRTIHHADCWEFNGRCSTFACGSMISRKVEED